MSGCEGFQSVAALARLSDEEFAGLLRAGKLDGLLAVERQSKAEHEHDIRPLRSPDLKGQT